MMCWSRLPSHNSASCAFVQGQEKNFRPLHLTVGHIPIVGFLDWLETFLHDWLNICLHEILGLVVSVNEDNVILRVILAK